jgi:hypothetical protein
MKAKHDNLEMVLYVARKLGNLLEEVVFLGGSATGLLISDPAVPDVRMTQDVDVIVEAATRIEYHRLEQKLLHKGFVQSCQSARRFSVFQIVGMNPLYKTAK